MIAPSRRGYLASHGAPRTGARERHPPGRRLPGPRPGLARVDRAVTIEREWSAALAGDPA